METAPAAAAAAAPEAVQGMTDKVSGAVDAVKDAVNKNPSYIIGIVFILFLIIFVAIYIYLKIRSGSDFFTMLAKPTPLNKVNFGVGADSDMPKATTDFTYSFWIYIKDLGASTTLKRRVFIRGDNPIVYLDENANTMHFRLKTLFAKNCGANVKSINYNYNRPTVGSTPAPTAAAGTAQTADANSTGAGSSSASGANNFTNDTTGAYLDMKVDYIPMNRWVHFVLTVDGQNVILYQDGDVYRVMPATIIIAGQCPAGTGTVSAVGQTVGLEATSGNAFIGPEDSLSPATDGFLSRLYFFNYALSLDKVRTLYNQGPTSEGLLSMLGISSYGIRSPIYKTSTDTESS